MFHTHACAFLLSESETHEPHLFVGAFTWDCFAMTVPLRRSQRSPHTLTNILPWTSEASQDSHIHLKGFIRHGGGCAPLIGLLPLYVHAIRGQLWLEQKCRDSVVHKLRRMLAHTSEDAGLMLATIEDKHSSNWHTHPQDKRPPPIDGQQIIPADYSCQPNPFVQPEVALPAYGFEY